MKPGPAKTIIDMKAYMRDYNAHRRDTFKRLGICRDCSIGTIDGKARCEDCLRVNRIKNNQCASIK